jgi:hypothetical protein
MTKPQSHVLPLFLILLTCLALCFISHSVFDRVEDLQAQIDANNAQVALLELMTGQAVGQLNVNDQFLVKQQSLIIKEVKRLGLNQETLLIQSLELAPEEVK